MQPLPATIPDPRHRPVWDVFCHVVDNLGDIGVCWRLCVDLASRGQQIRLWVDQPDPLGWMAPGALEGAYPGVQVIPWTMPVAPGLCESLAPAQVWVEAFGCNPPPEALLALARRLAHGGVPPVWINLEYLSAEPYVERSHGLPSPVMSGPLKGLTKWFFFPGFTPATGGLLRESDLAARRARFDPNAWLRARGWSSPGGRRVSVFCYESAALPDLLRQAGAPGEPAIDWLITSGRAAQAVRAASGWVPERPMGHMHALPLLPQTEFDHLLWASDFNLVRGEDSLVRALWAGQPFVWHIYPQHDNAHHAKLEAFLDWLDAPDSLRTFHRAWNGVAPSPAIWPGWAVVDGWRDCVRAAGQRLASQADLSEQLLRFIDGRTMAPTLRR